MELLPPAYRRGGRRWGVWTRIRRGTLLFTDDGELAHRLISTILGAQGVLCPPRGAGDKKGCGSLAGGLVLGDGLCAFRPSWNLWDRERAW